VSVMTLYGMLRSGSGMGSTTEDVSRCSGREQEEAGPGRTAARWQNRDGVHVTIRQSLQACHCRHVTIGMLL